MRSVFDVLQERGFIHQTTDDDINTYLSENKISLYCGFDPTADSLHVGHLLPIIALCHFQQHGHKPVALIGGATGMIGDPTGKSEERNLLTADDIQKNVNGVKKQIEKILSTTGNTAIKVVNNYDWTGKTSFIEWLRDIGKHFTVNYMLAKESVKNRIGSEAGISFTEFSYMTIQANDFLHLYETEKCTLQFGGSDQWGNITAGLDLIRKKHAAKTYGITCPLVMTSTGEKIGKTAGNATWIDPERTSPYQFYQYWINTTDEDVERLLKLFTFLPLSEIEETMATHQEAPGRRTAQKLLAAEVTKLIHGEEGLQKAVNASNALFGGDLNGLSAKDLKDIFQDVPSTNIERSELAAGIPLLDLLINTGLQNSKGNARRLVQQGGCYINNEKYNAIDMVVTTDHLLSDSIMVIRNGKKKYHLIHIV